MKQMIVFLAMVSLGCMLFTLIAGNDNSIYSSVKKLWIAETEMVNQQVR